VLGVHSAHDAVPAVLKDYFSKRLVLSPARCLKTRDLSLHRFIAVLCIEELEFHIDIAREPEQFFFSKKSSNEGMDCERAGG
jgi:hypothetical protein